jgi:rSAM/selenodomain-associated transferase 1
MHGALIVMAKKPTVSTTKTRLCPPLTREETAGLYRCFLLDTLELMTRVDGVQPIIAYLPLDAEPFFKRLAPPGFEFIRQMGTNLAERLDYVLTQCLQKGHRQVVAVDSDSPTLPVAYLKQAFRALEDSNVDVVIGPCDDGGYYLIGIESPRPALFQGMVMSTSTVTAETLERARRNDLRSVRLPTWYDVDTAEDLEKLIGELRSQPNHPARHTRAFLSEELGRL